MQGFLEGLNEKCILRMSLVVLLCSHELKVLETKNNTISLALTVGLEGKAATHLGSQLFTRGVSGTRVVTSNTKVSHLTALHQGGH